MLTEMGNRGWELTCMLESPAIVTVGLGTITYKVLFFFQRLIMQAAPGIYPVQGYSQGYPVSPQNPQAYLNPPPQGYPNQPYTYPAQPGYPQAPPAYSGPPAGHGIYPQPSAPPPSAPARPPPPANVVPPGVRHKQ